MEQSKQGLGVRLEEAFLGVFRAIILLALAICVLGVGYFAFAGVTALTKKPETFNVAPISDENVLADIRGVIEAAKETPQQELPKPTTEQTKNIALEAALDSIVATENAFLSRYDVQISKVDLFKESIREEIAAKSLDKSDEGLAAFAAKQAAFIKKQLSDPRVIASFDQIKEDRDALYRLHAYVLSYYPNYYAELASKKEQFDADQAAASAARTTQAYIQLALAGGLFAAFLIISLILVMIKIERNLRRP